MEPAKNTFGVYQGPILPAGLVPAVLGLATKTAPPTPQALVDLALAVAAFAVYGLEVICQVRTCGRSSRHLPTLLFPQSY